MDNELDRSAPDPEEIYRQTRDERQRMMEEHKSRFIDAGPEELRSKRVDLWQMREAAVRVISRKVRLQIQFARAQDSCVSADEIADLQNSLDQALNAYDRHRTHLLQAQELYNSAARTIQLSEYPPGSRDEANRLLNELDLALAACRAPT